MNNILMRLWGFLFIIPALIIAITVHEFMHGFVSYKFGDPTPKQAGRLTLNPLAHLDLLGSIMIFLINFGWGKPMPINPAYYRRQRLATALVSLAGPGANFAVAVLAAVLLHQPILAASPIAAGILLYLVIISLYLAVFNLIPLPPLDGSKVVAVLLPRRWLGRYFTLERYGIILIFLAFIVFHADRLLTPLVNTFLQLMRLPPLS